MRGSRDYSYPLRVAADKYPGRTAFVYRDERWSFHDFDRATDNLAAAFEERGLTGQRVVLLQQNEPLTVMALLALARAGAVAVPVNPRLIVDELAFVVDDAGAAAIVTDPAFAGAARELHSRRTVAQLFTSAQVAELIATDGTPVAEVDPDSPALMVYTSGTTGFPKGVVRTHDANLWATVNATLGQPRSTCRHRGLRPAALRDRVHLPGAADDPPGRDGGARRRVRRSAHLGAAGTASRDPRLPGADDARLDAGLQGHESRDVSSLRTLNTAYEFPEAVREANAGAVRRHRRLHVRAQRGSALLLRRPSEFAADPTNAGHAQGMMRVRVVDENREAFAAGRGRRDHHGGPVADDRLPRPEVTADTLAAGWLYTGDLGYRRRARRVHMTGRKKEMIKSGGFSVDPVEVEKAILELPGRARGGRRRRARRALGRARRRVRRGLRGRRGRGRAAGVREVADHGLQVPEARWFVDELPKNPMGKIQRGRLRELASEQV